MLSFADFVRILINKFTHNNVYPYMTWSIIWLLILFLCCAWCTNIDKMGGSKKYIRSY